MKLSKSKIVLIILVILLSLTFIFSSILNIYKSSIKNHSQIVNNLSKNNKKVLISFDDGPGIEDYDILDILKKWNDNHPLNKVHTIFFQTGNSYKEMMQNHPKEYIEIQKRILNEGHWIGNHSDTHTQKRKNLNWWINDMEVQANRILDMYKDNGISNIKKSDIPTRMPGLGVFHGIEKMINKLDLKFLTHGYMTCDWKSESCGNNKILKDYSKHITSGQIFVSHSRAYTKQWLDEFLNLIESKGFGFIDGRTVNKFEVLS